MTSTLSRYKLPHETHCFNYYYCKDYLLYAGKISPLLYFRTFHLRPKGEFKTGLIE